MIAPRPTCVHSIKGWGGVPMHVPEYGNPDGPAIVLIHGWSQCHLSWAHQLTGALADSYRLIAPDLRGHGNSGKPDAPEHYNTSPPWAEDIRVILAELALERPVLVGWSMGGWIVQDYLSVHGDTEISGFSLVGSSGATGRFTPLEALQRRVADDAVRADGMYSEDLAQNLTATLAFVQACFATPQPPDDVAVMVGFNMLCPPSVRAAARKRHEDYRPVLRGITCPALVQWGIHERLLVSPMAEDTLNVLPNGKGIVYKNSGHAPFWEEPDLFNTDILNFAKAVLS